MPVSASSQQEFSDADWRAVSSGDQSKKLKFLLSAISANTTRVWTVPDADVTISAFVATLLDDATAGDALTTLGAVAKSGDTMTGNLAGPSFYSGNLSIADDAVADMGDMFPNGYEAIFFWRYNSTGSPAVFNLFQVRTGSPAINNRLGPTTNIATSTSDVTGTTGTDGNVTFSATAGHLKVENRIGATLAMNYIVFRRQS